MSGPFHHGRGPGRRAARRPFGSACLQIEELERRELLAANAAAPALVAQPAANAAPTGLTPAQVRHAYGFDQIAFGGGAIRADGSGQTIAIVEAGDDPNIVSDLAVFDRQFGLPDPPGFARISQTGSTALPGPGAGAWPLETALDVEWAHAIAPGANILLVEANSGGTNDLLAAVDTARHQPGVVAVSISWAASEVPGLSAYDGYFTTPTGHVGGSGLAGGVTFVACAGDSSAAANWPATSANVLAVGGTNLSVDAAGNYLGETAWSSASGNISAYTPKPGYQGRLPFGARTVPDVAYNAGPGFALYNSYANSDGWMATAGTSAGAPQWAALVAIVDQGRALGGQGALDGAAGLLPLLYNLSDSDFHDIIAGSNGHAAGGGYDLATGRGSPVADRIIRDLVGAATVARVPAASVVPSQPVTQVLRVPSPAMAAPERGTLSVVSGGAVPFNFTVTLDHALYRHDPAGGWARLGNPGTVAGVTAAAESSGNVVAFVLTMDHALWQFDPTSGWTALGAPGTIQFASAGTDRGGRAEVFVITTPGGLAEFREVRGWAALGAAGTIQSISAAGQGQAAVVTADQGVCLFDDVSGWSTLAGSGFARSVSAVADGAGRLSVFAVTAEGGLFSHEAISGWTQLGATGSIQSVSAGTDAAGQALVVAVTGSGALARYSHTAGWARLSGAWSIQRAAAGSGGRIAVISSDGSVREYNDASGWAPLTASGFAQG